MLPVVRLPYNDVGYIWGTFVYLFVSFFVVLFCLFVSVFFFPRANCVAQLQTFCSFSSEPAIVSGLTGFLVVLHVLWSPRLGNLNDGDAK